MADLNRQVQAEFDQGIWVEDAHRERSRFDDAQFNVLFKGNGKGKGKGKGNGKGKGQVDASVPFTGGCNWCGKPGHKANDCEEAIKYFKEKGWGRQAPSAVSVEYVPAPNVSKVQRNESLKVFEWIINMKKPADTEHSNASSGAPRMF